MRHRVNRCDRGLEGLIQGTKEELSEYAEIGTTMSRLAGDREAIARRARLDEEQSKLRAVQRPNYGDLESRMTILAERINKGERVLEKTQQLGDAKDGWETYLGGKSVLETRISMLERRIEFV